MLASLAKSRAGRSVERPRKTARPAAGAATVFPRQTWRRPGAWWCRGCACPPSGTPSDRGTLRFLELLEAQSKERRLLRVADARLDLALAIRVAHAAGQCRDAVVGEHVAIERVERRIVDVGVEHALAQVVDHRHARRAAQAAESHLVQLRPDPRAGLERQQSDRLAAVPEPQHEEPRAAVLARLRIAHHRALAVIDLGF